MTTSQNPTHTLHWPRLAAAAAFLAIFVVAALIFSPFSSQARHAFAEEDPVEPSDAQAPPADSIGTLSVRLHDGPLVGRTVSIEIFAASEEPLYTASLPSGQSLAERVTRYELEALVPGLDLESAQGALTGLADIPID